MPIGEIKDYYKNGKIQSIIEGATSLDNNDDSNSVWQGKSKLFYESGELSLRILIDYFCLHLIKRQKQKKWSILRFHQR